MKKTLVALFFAAVCFVGCQKQEAPVAPETPAAPEATAPAAPSDTQQPAPTATQTPTEAPAK
jgi:PBP1b-binding outer membrane lipoprotein LpoB